MNKKLSKKVIAAIIAFGIIIRILSVIITGAAAVFTAYVVYESFWGDTESAEEHVTKTLPQSDDHDLWIFGVRDYTVYGKYYYNNGISENILNNHELFKKVSEDNIVPLRKIIEDYEGWVESTKDYDSSLLGDDISKVYDFDMNLLREKSCYYYFEAKDFDTGEIPYEEIEIPLEDIDHYFSYTLYIYCDKTLYIMHNDT